MANFVAVFTFILAVLWGALSISADTLVAKSPAVIACFHKKIGRFTGVA